MVVELTALTTAVQATAELVKGAGALVSTIRSGLRVDNEEAKEKLSAQLGALKQSLASVGSLAGMAERYMRTHEEVISLLGSGQRAQRLLLDGIDDFSDSASVRYEGNWRVMEALFSDIDAAGRPIQEAVYNRIRWFSSRDQDQIDPLLTQFDSAFRSAEQAVRYKASSDVRTGLEQMLRPVQTAETLIRNTLFGEILPALQSLSASGD